MTPEIYQWAVRNGVPMGAVQELAVLFGAAGGAVDPAIPAGSTRSEAYTQSVCRLAAASAGYLVWRNNVGAMQDDTGRVIRFGLANDSAALNARIKSADLIGIKPGGQFWSRECKAEGWKYRGTDRERAQMRWIELVTAQGGDAAFTTGEI